MYFERKINEKRKQQKLFERGNLYCWTVFSWFFFSIEYYMIFIMYINVDSILIDTVFDFH